MMDHHPVSCLRICGYSLIITISVLSGTVQIVSALSKESTQSEIKVTNSNAFGSMHSLSVESVMSAIINPTVLLASVKDEIRNDTNNITTFNQDSSGLSSVRESATALLSHQILPPKDFMPIYSSNPYTMAKLLLTAKLPCERDFHSPVLILAGELTNLKPVAMVPVRQLSTPGYLCMYNSYWSSFELDSKSHDEGIVTKVVLFNPTSHRIVLLNTSTIILSVTENPLKTHK